MGFLHITIDRSLGSEFATKSAEIPDKFQETLDQLKEEYGVNISIYTPIRDGGLVSGNIVEDLPPFGFVFDNEQPYYPFVILGTAPHWIGSPVLIDDNWVYIGEHPGTAPQDFMEWAFEATDPDPILEDFIDWVIE